MMFLRKSIAVIAVLSIMFATASCSIKRRVRDDLRAPEIEKALDLTNNDMQEWVYDLASQAWILSPVMTVTDPEVPDEQGVSVCVPDTYINGIDIDGDGYADVNAKTYTEPVKGSLVIDHNASVASSNGQVYTAETAPVIINTGAAGYSSSVNVAAAANYAKEGYINVSCGNRGKQDKVTDDEGSTYFTGDAPCCLIDQKNAIRFIKYNILLGNLPGNVDRFVSTGGSGGGAHAVMIAATSDNPDFYDYEIEAGAVGVYKRTDGSYYNTVKINGVEHEISDGVWGCIAYSAITPLKDADMAMAFEYYLDKDYDFGSEFKKKLAELLAEEYAGYINNKKLMVDEKKADLDINFDGDKKDSIKLKIEYDKEKYHDTNGYGGSYLDFYLAEFVSSLQKYIDNIEYAEDFTWFAQDGSRLADEEVMVMTAEDKARAFLEGRYTGTYGMPKDIAKMDHKDQTVENSEMKELDKVIHNADVAENSSGDKMDVGTPLEGTTQSSDSSMDSLNYSGFKEMLKEYTADIDSIRKGDKYGKNIVDLYDPLNYIGAAGTKDPTWTRIVMGAAEGDMPLFSSLNIHTAFLNAGVDSVLEWQWDGGHVPSEIMGDSFSLYVDEMYSRYIKGANEINKSGPSAQRENGKADAMQGNDISAWVKYTDGKVSFSLDAASEYRTAGANKAVPGFDVIDYGQEDYVFGNKEKDARHWDEHLLNVFLKKEKELNALFNR